MGSGPPGDDESALAPSIPSFASLRRGPRRSPADVLVALEPVAVEPVSPARRPGAARPPEWPDLWHLGLRAARWCVHQPITRLRRLAG